MNDSNSTQFRGGVTFKKQVALHTYVNMHENIYSHKHGG